MARASLLPLLKDARERRYALASFNIFDLTTALAVIEVAEKARSPIIVAVAEAHFPYTDFEVLGAALGTLADKATVPVVLHLDHAETLDVVMRAMRAGFTSFQFDGYGLPFEERVRQTRSVVDLAHSLGFSVEAELGHITKVGQDAADRDNLLADPSAAADFVARTGVDVVAAAVGTVHGLAVGAASLDFERLARIVADVPCAVSLHGGSGLRNEDVRRAIGLGVTKFSYFTGLGKEAIASMRAFLADHPEPQLPDVLAAMRTGFEAKASERLTVFGSVGCA